MRPRSLTAAVVAATILSAAGMPAAGATPAMPASVTPPEHRRPPDQTFLTYPEWFLVFSPAEYATFVGNNPPSEFPFIGHVREFWQGYDAVWHSIRGRYPFNGGYHVMIVVIGTSTTGEYLFRSAYETLFGRLAELTRTHGMTAEERLGARVAQEYVDFIRIWPWYQFDFVERLVQLWTTTDLLGPDLIRKWERKYALTSEYAAKAIYGWLIKKATKAAYEDPLPVTAVVVDRLPADPSHELSELKVLEQFADGSLLITVPRYEAFTRYSSVLARKGARFLEIAGNRGPIMVSVLESDSAARSERAAGVFLRQPILTEPGTTRLLIAVPVASLAATLNQFSGGPHRVEHVFDY
jgi:hypothetical protein